jgi:deazaflavin-dependent oxidoreductase (nitroreductase family)
MAEKKLRPWTEREEKLGHVAIKLMSAANTWAFRVSGGRLGARFPGGAPVLLLTTVGKKSGQKRTAPLLYLKDGDNYVIVASKGGMSHNPGWYWNLLAKPEVEIEVGHEKMAATARRAGEAEKKRLWPQLVAMYPSYDDYQARTDRQIPVVILTPRS